jgi:xylulose-5-phosphate/fructose-6-phosphate phosphoketolase
MASMTTDSRLEQLHAYWRAANYLSAGQIYLRANPLVNHTRTAPVVFAFHGHPRVVHELIHHQPDPVRFHVRGYMEEGTTTTPFDMVVCNQLSRYHLAMEALRRIARVRSEAGDLIGRYEQKLAAHKAYIYEHGEDMPEVRDWKWT